MAKDFENHVSYLSCVRSPGGRDIKNRLERIIAVFNAIEAGELLCALPDCEIAQIQHKTAINLLSLAEIEIRELYSDIS